MPIGTKVDKLYERLKKRGYTVKSAVRIAQAKTGDALATGKPAKHHNDRKVGLINRS